MQATIECSEGVDAQGRRRPSPGASATTRWLRSRQRVLLSAALLLAGGLALSELWRRQTESLAVRLSADGLLLREPPRAVAGASGALLVAEQGAGPSDVLWIDAPVQEGRVARSGRMHNLTRSSGADESQLLVSGQQAFYAVRVGGRLDALERLDFRGNLAPAPAGRRLRLALSNWQHTGRLSGIARERYRFTPPVEYVRLKVEGEQLAVDAGLSGHARIALGDGSLVSGQALLERHESRATVPEWVPWLVDRARDVPWIGPEAIAWLEQRVFGVRDRLERAYRQVQPVDGAAEAARALGLPAPATRPIPGADLEGGAGRVGTEGWPPQALEPLLQPAVEGEGEWRAVAGDPFVREWPGGGPLFFQTFLRGDEERPYNQTYLTLWDPRRLQLHVVSGIEEPVSATGETGEGTVPKDPATLGRLVAAFNGGFQALHGEFGMMADGRVYLPPKPWAATVAVFRDGRVGMGSWPGPRRRGTQYDEARAVAEIPADMVSLRQNLTSLVEDGRVNPWERWWWGAAPSGSSEDTLTQRSALCLREDGHMLYAWGDFLEPEALGRVLAAAGCVRAMHLDMNAGHTGFEFYNVLAPGEPRAEVERVRGFQYEGPLPSRPGYRVRARRAVTSMQMPLPRFIRADPRDFFYLTVKPTLPGPPLQGAADGAFDSRGLPPSGSPPALARHVDGAVRVLRLDPRRLGARPAEGDGPVDGATPLVQLAPGRMTAGGMAVYLRDADGRRAATVGLPPVDALVLAAGPALDERPQARAWLGVDTHGFLVYAESNAPRLAPWASWLERLQVERAVALGPSQRLGLHHAGHVWTPDGAQPLRRAAGAVTVDLFERPAAGAQVLFPDNRPRPYRHWAFLQDQRVRYFRTEPPSARAPSEALAPGVAPAPSPPP